MQSEKKKIIGKWTKANPKNANQSIKENRKKTKWTKANRINA